MAEGDIQSSSVQANNNSVAVGSVSIGGSVGGDFFIGNKGFSAEEVSVLVTQISTTFQVKPFDGRCPYKGLETFNEEDTELFFGREKWVENLMGRVKQSRTLFVTGQSGSGKSSLVRAGMIPALKKAGYSAGWLYGTLKPGRDPIDALGNMFSRLKDPGLGKYLRENAGQASVLHECAESVLSERTDQRLVLFIDQFEEVFTQLSKDKAQTFINLLDHAATVENGRVIILFSMRSDFVPNCATYPQLNDLLNQQFVQIGAMQPEELVSAIAQPALRVGLKIDPDLIAQIINDMKGEPGALPLMQFALKDLFDAEQAKGGMIALTLSDYLEHGGISQALERHANASLAQLTDAEKELARNVFSGLIEIGRGTQDTRRTALSNELIPAGAQADAVKTVVQKLASARLVTTDATTVTISHEKLIDAWPWLKKLVNENRDVIALQNEIAEDAKEWEEHKRDASYLYSGARLATAREKMTAQKLMLSGLAQDFIEQSIALQEAARKARETLRRRIVIGLVSGIAIALALAAFGLIQARLAIANAGEAQKQAQISRAGELTSLALSQKDEHYNLAMLLALEGYKALKNPRTLGTLLTLANSQPGLEFYLSGHQNSVASVAFSPDGKVLASGSWDNTIILWNTETHQPIGVPFKGHSDKVTSLAFSPNGNFLASGSWDNTVILWDTETRQPIANPLQGHTSHITSLAISSDGSLLVSGSEDGALRLWKIDVPGNPILIPKSFNSPNGVGITSVAISPDNQLIAAGFSDKVFVWNISNTPEPNQLIQISIDGAASSLAFSPKGTILGVGSIYYYVGLFDTNNFQEIGRLNHEHGTSILSIAFNQDGTMLASGNDDNTILLWNINDPSFPSQWKELSGSSSKVTSVAFSPDGEHLASGSSDNAIILWNINTPIVPAQIATLPVFIPSSVAFSPDGEYLASGGYDNNVVLWNVQTKEPITLYGHNGAVSSVTFSPDEKLLASGSWDDHTFILWDVKTQTPLSETSSIPLPIYSVAFSPNNKYLAVGNEMEADGKIPPVTLWDVSNPKMPRKIAELFGHQYRAGKLRTGVASVAFSPDGKTLASGSSDKTIRLWDVSSPELPSLLTTLPGTDTVLSVAFSHDGKLLASGSEDGTIIVWDMKTNKSVSVLRGHSKAATSVALDPANQRIASGSRDFTTILWDISNLESPYQLVTLSDSEWVNGVAFNLNGGILATGGDANHIILWDTDTKSIIEKLCQRAGRNFTRAEWAQYFPDEEYRKTCEQWSPAPEPITIPTVSP